ncbi:MAG: nitroreductase family protein [Calditrichia bacterium]
MKEAKFIPLSGYQEYPEDIMIKKSSDFFNAIRHRRTVRHFSEKPVPRMVIENCIRAAGTAPSGANKQPWHFVVVSNPEVKKKIRIAAEKEEREFYRHRAPRDWLESLEPFGTDAQKPFLETAPYLIAIFSQSYELAPDGSKIKNYYVQESVGIATGILITALHMSGLVSLTHTPSPMAFLNKILKRPRNERAFLLLITGYPADNVQVPDISKKSLLEISTFID